MTGVEEKFEDTKGLIRSRKSKKDRQHNGQRKQKDTGKITIYKTLHRKLMIEKHEPHLKPGRTRVLLKGKQFMLHMHKLIEIQTCIYLYDRTNKIVY